METHQFALGSHYHSSCHEEVILSKMESLLEDYRTSSGSNTESEFPSEDSGYNSDDNGVNPASSLGEEDSTSDEDAGLTNAGPQDFDTATSVNGITFLSASTGSSEDDSDGDEEENVDVMIDYLRQKQDLLKRVSTEFRIEDAYTAATALQHANHLPHEPQDSIWTHAKRAMLQEPGSSSVSGNSSNSMGGGGEDAAGDINGDDESTHVPRKSHKRHAEDYEENTRASIAKGRGLKQSPKDPMIDTSGVSRIISSPTSQGDDDVVKMPRSYEEYFTKGILITSFHPELFLNGQWMAQALVWSTQGHSKEPGEAGRLSGNENINSDDEESQDAWRVVSDPRSSSLGLVPPFGVSAANPLTLQEAITITDEPRLIAQSTPPFCVVYANKAFLQFADLQDQHSVIGKPIETILQVTHEILDAKVRAGLKQKSELFLRTILTSANKPCKIRVIPVYDCPKRRRMSPSSLSNSMDIEPGPRANNYSCISHVLVPVFPIKTKELGPACEGVGHQPMTITVIEEKYDSEPPNDHTAFGTVG